MTAEDIAPRFLIGEVSRAVGVSPQTLRLWEREGLVKARRTEKGYRAYDEADVERLQQIKRLRQFEGLNYAAIRKHLGSVETVPDRNGSGSYNGSTDSDGSVVLGERLRFLRLKARKTLKEVSETTGLSISFISTLERGGTGASVASLRQLAQAYGMTMRELFGAELNREHLLVRQADRPTMRWDNNVCFEEMASEGWLMNPSYIKVPPETGSGGFYLPRRRRVCVCCLWNPIRGVKRAGLLPSRTRGHPLLPLQCSTSLVGRRSYCRGCPRQHSAYFLGSFMNITSTQAAKKMVWVDLVDLTWGWVRSTCLLMRETPTKIARPRFLQNKEAD